VCYLQQRHALLEDSIHLYGFYRECDDFEKWIKDRERMLRADDSTDNVEAAKRKYEVRDLGHMFHAQNTVLAVTPNQNKPLRNSRRVMNHCQFFLVEM
jgi:hypothetical protein